MTIHMKKIFILAVLLAMTTGVFTACQDDRDSNPTLVQAKEFVLNTPAYSSQTLDLKASQHLNLAWSQPDVTDLHAPLAGRPFYQVQISKDGNFNTSVAQAEADASGATVADYVELDEAFPSCTAELSTTSLDKCLMKLYKWEDGSVPATAPLFLRVVANFVGSNASAAPGVRAISNVVKLNVVPYYMELRDAAPDLWYLVGGLFADGSWGNAAEKIGLANVPMFPIDGFEYDKKTGVGSFTYTDYFRADDSFKILPSSFKWEYAFISKGGSIVNRDGGDDADNLTTPGAGYYTITVDGSAKTCTIVPAEGISGQAPVYERVSLIGLNGDWDTDIDMTPVNTKAKENHIWMLDIEVSANTTGKFRANHSWDVYDWGKASFPFGRGTKGGKDIEIQKGKYKVFFNDLTGDYQFIAQ